MNTLVLPQTNFAFTTDALKLMQDATGLIEKIAALGGDNYILSGCVVSGDAVSSGYMVLNGMIMPFVGHTKSTYVIIVQETNTVTIDTATRTEMSYHAEFGIIQDSHLRFPWADLDTKRVSSGFVNHGHAIDKISGLQTALDGKASTNEVASKIDKGVTKLKLLYSNGGSGGSVALVRRVGLTYVQIAPAYDVDWAPLLAIFGDSLSDGDVVELD